MLQSGTMATASIVAMEQMLDWLAEDHSKARLLADMLSDVTAIIGRAIDDI